MDQKELFRNPPAAYRGKPFWAWNGRLEEKELLRQIDVFQEMGFGGFFMHSRTGLETEYLGKEWFEDTSACIRYAEKKKLEPWLYDEDRWPSGSAGGMATAKRKYRASFLEAEQKDRIDWEKEAEETNGKGKERIACFACRMEGCSFSRKRRLETGDALQDGETALLFSVVEAPCREVYNGNTYLDTMNPEAVKYFIELTHERYAAGLSEEDFEKVCGIFTDEPHRGSLFTSFNGGREEWVPYTPKLFETFQEMYGYDLREFLPELFFREKGQRLSRVTYHYIALCQELFLDSFARPIQEWCAKHRMKLTGHVLHEDSLIAQTLMQGSLMRFYECMDIPGIDHLLRDNRCFWIVKQAVSVAKQFKKPWVLSELYGATGWKSTLEEYKQIGDWQALFGINLRCPHLAWYTMKGEAKRDYPASISFHLAGWKEYRYLEDYFSRLHVFLEQGEEKEGMLVISPVESVWARSSSGAYDGLESRDAVINQIENDYEKLFEILTRNQIGFDYGDEGILASHGSVQDGILKVGACRYHGVIICGMQTIRSSTLLLLRQMEGTGGTVIFAGDVPAYMDVLPSREAAALAEKCIRVPMEENQIVKACEQERTLIVSGEGRKDILVCRRKNGSRTYYMMLNQNRKEWRKHIVIRFEHLEELEEWNARTGEVTSIPVSTVLGRTGTYTEYILDFAPGGEKLLCAKASCTLQTGGETYASEKKPGGTAVNAYQYGDSAANPVLEKQARVQSIPLPESNFFRLSEKNLCVLDRVSVCFHSVDGKEYRLGKMEVLRAEREMRRILRHPMRGGEMLQPWYSMKYKKNTKERQQVAIKYSFRIQKKTGMLTLVLENTEQILRIRINRMEVPLSFQKKWIDVCFGQIELSEDLLREGENEIEILQEFNGQDGLEAAYLQGDFSVYLEDGKNPVLGEIPKKLEWGDITQQGFPFYSGIVTYCIPEQEEYQGRMRITAGSWTGWTMSFMDVCGSEHFAGFAPYMVCCDGLREIRLFLTRKNTFGPLHEREPNPELCEPDSFLTSGKKWSKAYVLQAQGIMEPPKLELIE